MFCVLLQQPTDSKKPPKESFLFATGLEKRKFVLKHYASKCKKSQKTKKK